MEDPVKRLKERFNGKVESDERVRMELQGLRRIVLIDLGGTKHTLLLDESGLHDIDTDEEPHIRVTATPDVLVDIMEGRLDPFKAYAENMVKVEASILDLIRARSFLSA